MNSTQVTQCSVLRLGFLELPRTVKQIFVGVIPIAYLSRFHTE
jgi:hypothetical protein